VTLGQAVRPYLGRRHLLTIGGVSVPSYTAMLYLGCTLGIFAGAFTASTLQMPPSRFAVAAVLLLIPALVGSRLYFVAQRIQRFRREPQRIWRRGDSGAALYGGLVLSLAVSAPVLWSFGLPFWRFWDGAIVTMIVGLIVTRFGCLLHGCCAGRETRSWPAMWLPNHRGEWRRRYPTPLLEAGLGVLLLAGVVAAGAQPPFEGARVLVVLCVYAAARLLLEPLREQDPHVPAARTNAIVWSALLVVLITTFALRAFA
jgi:phosphatidylglycerol---prolipoprotein diacylglyceryl transferase